MSEPRLLGEHQLLQLGLDARAGPLAGQGEADLRSRARSGTAARWPAWSDPSAEQVEGRAAGTARVISVAVTGMVLPARMRIGTPAQRHVSSASRTAT